MAKPLEQDNLDNKDSFVDELRPGTKLMYGQYTIESFLNAGGFGITYLARDSLDRKIVIKECFPGAFCRRSRYVVQARSRAHQNELRSIVRLFVQEARSLSKLDHPNIVGVHQVFEDNDTAYMALDFVEGRDLLDTIEDPNHGLTPVQIKSILKEVLGAVGFIHEQGILHRDISPDNILIDTQFHPVLIDFGAAREEATKQGRVLSALRVVKDGYSPQEFYVAGSDQSPSSDLYALAASFYHLIAKEVPPNSQARLAAIASTEPDPYVALEGRITGYDASFLAAIDKALCVLPKDRVQSAQDWLDLIDGNKGNVTALNLGSAAAVAAVLEEQAHAPVPEEIQTAPKKSKIPVLLGTVALLAISAGVGMLLTNQTDSFDAPVPVTNVAPETAVAAPSAAEPDAPAAAVQETSGPELLTPNIFGLDPASTAAASPDLTATELNIALPDSAAALSVPDTQASAVAVVPPAHDIPFVAPDAAAPAETVIALPEPLATPQTGTTDPAVAETLPDLASARPAEALPAEEVVFPPTPDTIEAIGAGPIVADLPAVGTGNALPPEVLENVWTVDLPFSASEAGSNVIGEIATVAPLWAAPGLEIVSVNGFPVDSIDQIPAALRATAPGLPIDRIDVTFGAVDPATGDTRSETFALPVVQQITMTTGLQFESTLSGEQWVTRVVAVPPALETDMQVGDILTTYIPTSESLTGRNSLADIVEREVAAGNGQVLFAVQRDGSLWVAALTVPTE